MLSDQQVQWLLLKLAETIERYRDENGCDVETALLAIANRTLILEVDMPDGKYRFVPNQDKSGKVLIQMVPIGTCGE